MLKTIAAFAALATLSAVGVAPAHASIEFMNGSTENGFATNGFVDNGFIDNGYVENGFVTNGWSNGGAGNGVSSGSSSLSIQAIELPPETR